MNKPPTIFPIIALFTFALMAAACGCCIEPEIRCPTTHISLGQLVSEYNTNAAAVPRIAARAKIEVTVEGYPAWGSTSPLASPNGLLRLMKSGHPPGPHDFLLLGRELAGAEVFRLGSSTDQGIYYFWAGMGDQSGAWVLPYREAGTSALEEMPIDPGQFLAVLGVVELPRDSTRLPAVAMSMSRDPCAYVLAVIDRDAVSGAIAFRREIYFNWDDTGLRRPFMVRFFSPDGRRVMEARLAAYQPIRMDDVDNPPDPAPEMPTDIVLETIAWPEEKVEGADERPKLRRIRMVLSDMSTKDTWPREACDFIPDSGGNVHVLGRPAPTDGEN